MKHMKKTTVVLLPALLVLLVLGAAHISVQPEEQPSFTGQEWALHIFAETGVAQMNYAPYEVQDLPIQMKRLGLDEKQVLFGRQFASFEQFSEAFEKANENHPVTAEALTAWDVSWHDGIAVRSRVFRIDDQGLGVAFFRPNVIVAVLGPHDKAVDNRDKLVEQNR